MDVIYFNFGKAFHIVSHSVQLVNSVLDKWTTRGVEDLLDCVLHQEPGGVK